MCSSDLSSSGPSARGSPSSGILETRKATLLGIGDQSHATPARAVDVDAFLVIVNFILQTQSTVNRCLKTSKSLGRPETGEKSPKAL